MLSGKAILPPKDAQLILNEEREAITSSLNIIKELRKKHRIKPREILELVKHREKYLTLPLGLFRSQLGPLEAVVRYLKDVLEYPLATIAQLLKRSETTVWTSYRNSHKKGRLVVDLQLEDISVKGLKREDLVIPLSVLATRTYSVLEAMCTYLREKLGLSYRDIGLILQRNERTVWTVVNRAKKKRA